jgi:hypothetical protein
MDFIQSNRGRIPLSADTSSELERLHEFILEKLADGASQLSPEDALDQWRAENPSFEELAESAEAVKRALADMEAGDAGRPANEVIADLRRKYGVTTRQ